MTPTENTAGARHGSARTYIRAFLYIAAIAIAIGGTWWATHRNGSVDAAGSGGGEMSGHDHMAMMGGGSTGSAEPVMLSADESRRIGVTYAVAEFGPLEKEIRTVGQIAVDETMLHTITQKIDGYVEELFVNATGQQVTSGDPLLSIYSPMLVQAQEELLVALRLERDLSRAGTTADRIPVERASQIVEAARRRLELWDIPLADIASIEASDKARRTMTLRAPASGYVLQKNVVAGQRIMSGDVLYQLADLHRVWVEGEVFEQDLSSVRVGQMVHADFEALPGVHRMARISWIYPTIDTDTRTARVRVVLPNDDLLLKPGMYATLRIVGNETGMVLTVPRDAVLSTGARNVVFVKEVGGMLSPREVAVGPANDTRITILRGLAAGDTVVASATFLVDAESNLGKSMGGMGEMPGMDMTAPPAPLPMKPPVNDPHAAHRDNGAGRP